MAKTAKTTQQLRFLSGIGVLTLLAVLAMHCRGPEAGAVDRIENGLLTAVIVKGQRAPMKLLERMEYYSVPGMSIAVIDNGQLAWAKGYGVLEAGGSRQVTTAAAGLWTTPSDLARFAIEVQQSSHGKSNRVLSAEMTRQMLTKQLGDYGLGMWLGGQGTAASFSHPGANEGFTCILTAFLENGRGAVVMTNGDRGSGLFNEVLRAIAHEYRWPAYQPIEKAVVSVDPNVYQTYVGTYQVSGLPDTTIRADAAGLHVSASPLASHPVTLYPSADDHFFMLENDIEVNFIRNVDGVVTGMQVLADGQSITATKVN